MLAARRIGHGCRFRQWLPTATTPEFVAGPSRAVETAACSSASSTPGSQRRRYHVAVIGSGPSGFYTSKYLMKQASSPSTGLKIDMFERLPVPFGLVRFGVAPDHPEVKNCINDFTTIAGSPGFRFFGNVQVGADVSLGDLRRAYDAVIVCTGAEGERKLGIPGEDLEGVVGSPPFVKWYNSHPDFVNLEPKDPGEAAVVLGHGNVALDIARILMCSPEKMRLTDIHKPALDRIARWQQRGLRTVHLFGRRGFVQAAFTNAELRELLTFDDEVLPIVDPAELALSRLGSSEQDLSKNRAKKRSVAILDKMAENWKQKDSTSKRILWLRFLWSPSALLGDDNGVTSVVLDRTELSGEPGQQKAQKASSGETTEVPCGLVVRSVGFDITPFEGLPMEKQRIPHEHGRVVGPSEEGGLYVSGWLKRGPQGIIASNIGDAQETATAVLVDLRARGGTSSANVTAVEAILKAADKRIVSFEDWRRIEAEELRQGAADDRSAVKIADVPGMLRLLDS